MSNLDQQQATYSDAVTAGYVGSFEHWLEEGSPAPVPYSAPELGDPASEAPSSIIETPDPWLEEQRTRLSGEMAEATTAKLVDPAPELIPETGVPLVVLDSLEHDGPDIAPPEDPANRFEDDDDEPEVDVAPLELNQAKVNFRMDPKNPATKPLPEGATVPDFAEALSLVRESYVNLTAVMEHSNELLETIAERDEKLVKTIMDKGRALLDTDGSVWLRTLFDSLTTAHIDHMGLKASERPDADWRNHVEVEGRDLRPGVPKQTLGDPAQLSKEELVGYFQRKSGTGTNCDFPFYHSGLWLRFKSPSLQELTALQYELKQVKVDLGAKSKGLAFSNMNQSLMSVAVDFALQFVIDANITYRTPTDLKERLDVTDEPSVLAALAAVMYPNGYAYSHPCVADPAKCQHLTKELLNFRGMQWTDNNSLTKWQKEFMAKRFRGNTKATDADLTKYRSERTRGKEKIVWFGDMGLELGTPTVLQHEESGRAWIDGIVTMTQGAFNEPPHGNNRNRYIEQLGQATTARQYAHWVTAVIERDDEGTEVVITRDPETIADILGTVMSTEEYVEDFFKKIHEYIEDSLISMIAVNSFNCPACDTPISKKFHERFEHLVPIDMLTTVFTLASRKLN